MESENKTQNLVWTWLKTGYSSCQLIFLWEGDKGAWEGALEVLSNSRKEQFLNFTLPGPSAQMLRFAKASVMRCDAKLKTGVNICDVGSIW